MPNAHKEMAPSFSMLTSPSRIAYNRLATDLELNDGEYYF
jgi:hypothetical protein